MCQSNPKYMKFSQNISFFIGSTTKLVNFTTPGQIGTHCAIYLPKRQNQKGAKRNSVIPSQTFTNINAATYAQTRILPRYSRNSRNTTTTRNSGNGTSYPHLSPKTPKLTPTTSIYPHFTPTTTHVWQICRSRLSGKPMTHFRIRLKFIRQGSQQFLIFSDPPCPQIQNIKNRLKCPNRKENYR